MRKKFLSILLSVLLCVGCAFCLNGCKDNDNDGATTTPTGTVITISANPSVEFIVNDNGNVVTATALNGESFYITQNANLTNKTVEKAVKLFAQTCVQKGFIYCKTPKITVSVNGKNAQEFFNSVKTYLNQVLSDNDISVSIEFSKITVEDLRLSVENAMQHLDEQEISKMTEKQLVSNLLTVRKEIAQLNLNSIELVDAYLQARANSVIKARFDNYVNVLSHYQEVATELKEQFADAINDLGMAISYYSFENAYTFLFDGVYQTKLQAYVTAKKAVIDSAVQNKNVAQNLLDNVENCKQQLEITKEQLKLSLQGAKQAVLTTISTLDALVNAINAMQNVTFTFTSSMIKQAVTQNIQAFERDYADFISLNPWANL